MGEADACAFAPLIKEKRRRSMTGFVMLSAGKKIRPQETLNTRDFKMNKKINRVTQTHRWVNNPVT